MKPHYKTNRLYKDSINKKISGVCAGLANRFAVDTWIVRLLTILAFFSIPVPVIIGYIAAAVMLPER